MFVCTFSSFFETFMAGFGIGMIVFVAFIFLMGYLENKSRKEIMIYKLLTENK